MVSRGRTFWNADEGSIVAVTIQLTQQFRAHLFAQSIRRSLAPDPLWGMLVAHFSAWGKICQHATCLSTE